MFYTVLESWLMGLEQTDKHFTVWLKKGWKGGQVVFTWLR